MARKKKLHSLQCSYIEYIWHRYACRSGSNRLYQPDKHAADIHRLGLNYDLYVELACALLQNWSDLQGWKYPYWTAVMSNSTMQRMATIVRLSDATELDDGYALKFQQELAYADSYVAWYIGKAAAKPKVCGVRDMDLRDAVAQYLCAMHGIEYLSSNYNSIARAMDEIR